jgi:hypothetical protein
LLFVVVVGCVNLTPPPLDPDAEVRDGGADVVVNHVDLGGEPRADLASEPVAPPDAGPIDMRLDMPADRPPEARPDATDTGPDLRPSTLGDGLVGYWRLDVINGTTTPDDAQPGYPGMILGGPTVVTGTSSLPSAIDFLDPGAFQFAQTDAAVVGHNSSPLPTSEITVAAWVKISTTANRGSCGGVDSTMHYILHHRNNRGVGNGMLEGVALTRQSDGRFLFILTANSSVKDFAASLPHNTTGIWFHVAGTFDGVLMRIYVNGQFEGMGIHPYPVDYDPTRPWFLARTGECQGAGEDDYDAKLNGFLDDVRIYDRALDSGEMFLLGNGAG